MKKALLFFYLILTLTLLSAGCESPECASTNKILNEHSPDEKVYKDELIRLLKREEPSHLRYWMGAYWRKREKGVPMSESILVHVKGREVCADMILKIKGSKKGIEQVIDKQMMGYRGAGLENLEYDLIQDSAQTEFVFRQISGIID